MRGENDLPTALCYGMVQEWFISFFISHHKEYCAKLVWSRGQSGTNDYEFPAISSLVIRVREEHIQLFWWRPSKSFMMRRGVLCSSSLSHRQITFTPNRTWFNWNYEMKLFLAWTTYYRTYACINEATRGCEWAWNYWNEILNCISKSFPKCPQSY